MIRHDGRVYFAFRTGPSHFASTDVVMYVVSSIDHTTWRFETEIRRGRDVREPRFLSLDGKLHLYFAELGDNPLDFEPGQMFRTTLDGGVWSTPALSYLPGFIPWRTRVVDGKPYMIGYVGGENIYDLNGEPISIHWLTTQDGLTFAPAVGSDPVVSQGGGSETDFAFTEDGDVIAIVRNEAGDELGWGSKICRGRAGDLGNWTCNSDPKKYDSPLVFKHGEHILLVGRRTLSNGGRFDLGRDDLSREDASSLYLLDYSEHPKRCALWRVDPELLKTERLIDLPSKGDTCFASVVTEDDGSYTIYNYTSPLDGEDVGWLIGQLGTTSIYRIRLTFE